MPSGPTEATVHPGEGAGHVVVVVGDGGVGAVENVIVG
jgi:hypothetical protein